MKQFFSLCHFCQLSKYSHALPLSYILRYHMMWMLRIYLIYIGNWDIIWFSACMDIPCSPHLVLSLSRNLLNLLFMLCHLVITFTCTFSEDHYCKLFFFFNQKQTHFHWKWRYGERMRNPSLQFFSGYKNWEIAKRFFMVRGWGRSSY